MNPQNLALHGIHFRGLHFLVNLPMLYGPLLLCIPFSFTSQKNLSTAQLPLSVRVTLFFSIVSGLTLLSLAPHQEPRFLVPLLFPLVILGGEAMYHSKLKVKMKELLLEVVTNF
jgi:phosphatidylinositol glycan class Z